MRCRDRGHDKKDTVHRGIGILELRPVNNIRRRRLRRANTADLLRGFKFKCYDDQTNNLGAQIKMLRPEK